MPDDPVVDPQPGTTRPTKDVSVHPSTVESIPWWQSTQMKLSMTVIGGALYGLNHAICKLFGWCIFQNFEAGDIGVLLSSIATLGGGLYWAVKRVSVGKDPTNTSAPITLK